MMNISLNKVAEELQLLAQQHRLYRCDICNSTMILY